MIVLDTSFLIDFLKNMPSAVSFVESTVEPIVTCEIVLHELYFGAYKNHKSDVERIDALLRFIPVLSYTKYCGKLSAKYCAELLAKGNDIGQTDCMIAATVLAHGHTKILTRNVKHFSRIDGLEVIEY